MKRIPLIVTLLLISAIALFLVLRKNFTKPSIDRFAIKDTAAVSKIFITDKKGHAINLSKQADGTWLVNDKFQAQPSKIELLLETMYRLKIKAPVGITEREDVIRLMAANAIKVMVYNDDKLMITYYVGNATADYLGTYVFMENEEDPQIVEIPGFNGYITPRYIVEEIDWRTRAYYRFNPNELSEIEINYPNNPNASFCITLSSGNELKLFTSPAEGKTEITDTDPINLKTYVNLFSRLDIEGYDTRRDKHFADSLKKEVPYCSITIKDNKGKIHKSYLYQKPFAEGKEGFDANGNPTHLDPERFFLLSAEDDLVRLVQTRIFGRILQSRQFFQKS